VTTWLVGLPGLICDSIQPAPFLITATHALFIIVTCSALCLTLVSGALASSSSSSTELYLYTRSVSRWIYVAVYGLALVRLGLYLCLPIHARSLDDFQFYIGWSVVPLWVIRTLILTIPSISDRRAGVSSSLLNHLHSPILRLVRLRMVVGDRRIRSEPLGAQAVGGNPETGCQRLDH